MPEAALASTAVDWILPLERIAVQLVELCKPASAARAPQLAAPQPMRMRS
jgi:hypothetical protein